MRIDLHVHSTASDGTDPPAEVMRQARAVGVDVVALTDHDTTAGLGEAARALPAGLTLVPGIELSCLIGSHSVHLLGYLFDPADPGLAAECAKIRDSRVERAQGMVARLRALGVPVTWQQVTQMAAGGTVGRPHVARAMLATGAIRRFDEAFTENWIAPGGRAYVGRYAPAPARAIGLVRAAGGVAGVAHPRGGRGWQLSTERLAELKAEGLAAVEVDHPDHDQAERAALRREASDLDLLVLGSSDDHGSLTGHRIGCETTSPGEYERLRGLATGTKPLPGHPG
ncbi:MAG TPA: PHP domain-containing protein [Streptosporangiaceae bacterium]|nr:PHP domain-containing protein [Streptosporangiaceae bacterium]